MRIPILPIIISMFFAAFVSLVFSFVDSSDKLAFEISEARAGRILGIEESIVEMDGSGLELNSGDLPQSHDILPAVPKLVAGNEPAPVFDHPAFLLDAKSGAVMYERDADRVVPVASLTKLVTALVFLDNNPGWDTIYRMKAVDQIEGGKVYLHTGERLSIRDLFNLSLVGSANTATRALVRSTGLTERQFVTAMNTKMEQLGLKDTKFADPIGLSHLNLSTAREAAKFVRFSLAQKEIRETASRSSHSFRTESGKAKTVHSTNIYLDRELPDKLRMQGGKTGYIPVAGYCFAGKYDLNAEHELISVVLNAGGLSLRFKHNLELAAWGARNHNWN